MLTLLFPVALFLFVESTRGVNGPVGAVNIDYQGHHTMAAPSAMRAVIAEAGECKVVDRPVPKAEVGECLVRAQYSAINRADTLQRKGLYAPPAGSTDVLGLEVVGDVVHASDDAGEPKFAVGDRVMALLSGGGNAEYVAVPTGQLMRIPEGMDWRTAAAIPETWLTAFQLLHFVGHAKAGETVIILAAASGVGTAAVQLAIGAGCRVIAVAGSDEKLAAVRKLADETASALAAAAGSAAPIGSLVATVNYKATPGWAAPALAATDGKGANLLLDPVGGSFWTQSSEALGMGACHRCYLTRSQTAIASCSGLGGLACGC